MLRDHEGIVIEEFNGLWRRGDVDSVPPDHFSDCNNIQFIRSGFKTRDGLNTYRAIANPVRIYNYVMQTGESLLILDTNGDIYHSINETTTYGPILSIPEMTDFGYVAIAGRAYITPYRTEVNALGVNSQRGLQNEFLYVYKGDGTAARKAAGAAPTGTDIVAANSATTGFNDVGFHLFGVVYETDTGYRTPPALFAGLTTVDGTKAIDISNIPVGGATVVKRLLVATLVIPNFNGDEEGYQYFFIPDGDIDNNIDTTKTVSFYDLDLLEDASHLLDNFSSIPAGVTLTTYHGRLVLTTTYDDISIALISAPGEPEAIDQVDGLIIAPLDGNPITNAQEYRDVLYVFKRTRTLAYNDNGEAPSSWPLIIIDQGIGASVHGVGTVLDSGGINIDFILIVDFSGLMLFNGLYQRPELSWKIRDLWFDLDRNDFSNIQIMNDSLTQVIYITLPDRKMLIADYTEGLNAKDIKWAPWSFDIETTTITLVETNKLIIGSEALYGTTS